MATNFPTSLDSLTNPSGTDSMSSPSHAGQHANANDAIEALQAKVGIDSSAVTTSLDYKVGNLESRPVETKTASYTLVAADVNKRIVMNSASATTITVNDSVFSAGDVVWIHNIGAGTCTITAGTATVNTAADLELDQWEGGSLYFTSASSAIFFRGPSAGVSYGVATGGDSSSTITVGGESYTLLTFLSSGTLTVGTAGVFDVLVVGGGGGGGTAGSLGCGGGGAGGYREYDKIYFDANQTVTVGAGGAVNASRGGHSRCGQPFAGGGGGVYLYSVPPFNGASGGGGGSGVGNGDGASGNDGGTGDGYSQGGGGGAGAAGGTGGSGTGGAGGAGLDASAFRGESAGTTYYAGGGGGEGTSTRGLGGSGVGGDGKDPSNPSTAGDTNTGGGGGGDGSAGGSGIVLVRFKN